MSERRPSLEGRRFTTVDNASGEVGTETVFTYHEDPLGDAIWADYAGGSVVRGRLVGSRTTAGGDARAGGAVGDTSDPATDTLDFRYVQLKTDGTTSAGHCVSQVEVLDGGRLRLHEAWAWESREGSGTSTLDELP